MLRVGLTGGIASGKSTVRRILDDLGAATLDADALVSDLYRPGRSGHVALVKEYGQTILNQEGEVDRSKLSATAFASPEAARRLNELIHPLVLDETAQIGARHAAAGALLFVVEATLLLEAGWRQRFDRIVVVDVPPELQVARAVSRGMDAREARRRMAHQMPREERLRQADYVIDNRSDERALREATEEVHARLLAEAAAR